MQTARLFSHGKGRVARFSKEFSFKGNGGSVQKGGNAVVPVPLDKEWDVFLCGLNRFSNDFMAEERFQGGAQLRDSL